MAKRLRALVGLSYPAPGSSVATVKRAGGMRNLSPEERAKIIIKRVEAGDWCDDVPASSRAWLLEDGLIAEVEIGDESPAHEDGQDLSRGATAK